MKNLRGAVHGVRKIAVYIFCLFLIIIGYSLYRTKTKTQFLGVDMPILKMAFPYTTSIKEYEPTNIQLAPQYALLENLYSPLIELSPKGDIQSGVAQSFEWHENELHLEIRKNLKSIDGIQITASDVEFSLKRLLVLTGNTHGNLRDILCPDVILKSVDDGCPNLEVRNDFLVVFKPPKKDVFLIKMLTAIDFAIIPKSSVDLKTLKIIDYRNTTGPYYVEKDDKHGNIILAANPSHYHYSSKIAQRVELVPSDQSMPDSSLEDFKNGKVDFITEADSTKSEKIIDFSKTAGHSTLHSTILIRMFLLTFTEKGLRKISTNQRFLVGKEMKNIFRKLLIGQGLYQPTDQVFPVFGEGSVSVEESRTIGEIYNKIENDETFDGGGLTLGFIRMGDIRNYTENIKTIFPKLEMFETSISPFFKQNPPENEIPDMIISGPDTGFLEDIALISYTLNAGILGLKKHDATLWLKNYMETIDKNERLKKLQSLHYEALIKPGVIPLVASPYVALVRKPWVLKLPKYFANNALWLVERD